MWPGQHVGEAGGTDRLIGREQEGDHLDHHHQRQEPAWHARRHEQARRSACRAFISPYTMTVRITRRGERERDDDMARDREAVRHQAEQVEHQHEHEDREHEREEAHPFLAGGAAHRRGDELVEHLHQGLDAAGHQRAAARRHGGEERDHHDRDEHVEGPRW
jgi:hypothetical protein